MVPHNASYDILLMLHLINFEVCGVDFSLSSTGHLRSKEMVPQKRVTYDSLHLFDVNHVRTSYCCQPNWGPSQFDLHRSSDVSSHFIIGKDIPCDILQSFCCYCIVFSVWYHNSQSRQMSVGWQYDNKFNSYTFDEPHLGLQLAPAVLKVDKN